MKDFAANHETLSNDRAKSMANRSLAIDVSERGPARSGGRLIVIANG